MSWTLGGTSAQSPNIFTIHSAPEFPKLCSWRQVWYNYPPVLRWLCVYVIIICSLLKRCKTTFWVTPPVIQKFCSTDIFNSQRFPATWWRVFVLIFNDTMAELKLGVFVFVMMGEQKPAWTRKCIRGFYMEWHVWRRRDTMENLTTLLPLRITCELLRSLKLNCHILCDIVINWMATYS